MTAKTKSKSTWPPIYQITYSSGKTAFQVACMIQRKRIREVYPTKGEAETRAVQIRAMVQNEGTSAVSLPMALRADASKCMEKLKPYKGSLIEAVDYYIEHCLKLRQSPPVREMVAQLLEDKKASNVRPRTLEDLRSRWGKFVGTFGDRRLSEITVKEFTNWLNKVSTGPINRHNYRRKISELYRAAIRHKWAIDNIVDATDCVLLDETTPGILTVDQAATLLKHAPDHGMLPYCVLGLFCGIRSDELSRLGWGAVNFAERTITIDAKVAKKRRQRIVPINDTAAGWLTGYVQRVGPIVESVNRRKRFDAWRKAAGIKRWPDNALRHSFGSYHLAACGDDIKTAMIMGHRDSEVLHRHYKALVSKADAQRFWDLRPAANAEKKIVSPSTKTNN
jgi:integrase